MGYSTDFEGELKFNKNLSNEHREFLLNLNDTRRMARDISDFGVEGEFYVFDDRSNVENVNRHPSTQPGLWCKWTVNEEENIDGVDTLYWDGVEKFYNYVEWLSYIINRVFKIHFKEDYVLNGVINWYGEDRDDIGKIIVVNNHIVLRYGSVVYAVDGNRELPTDDNIDDAITQKPNESNEDWYKRMDEYYTNDLNKRINKVLDV